MSKLFFDVVLQSGTSYVVEADKIYPDASGRAVAFQLDGETVAQFYGVASAVKQPPVPGPSAEPGLCVSAVTELGFASALRRFGSPLAEAIESAAAVVADLEQLPVAGPLHLVVLGRMNRHLELLLAEQADALCRPIGSAPARGQ